MRHTRADLRAQPLVSPVAALAATPRGERAKPAVPKSCPAERGLDVFSTADTERSDGGRLSPGKGQP